MDVYKNFIQRLTIKTFDDVYFLLHGNICTKLKEYVVLLQNIQFEDGKYHAYYGMMKRIVISSRYFYSQSIYEIGLKSDKYKFNANIEDLLALLEETANIYQINQIEYGREFLPAANSTERQMYDKMEVTFNEHMIKLKKLGEKIKLLNPYNQDRIDEFAQEQIDISIQRTSELFKFVEGYISMMLSQVTDKIRISLEEIQLRLQDNLQRVQEKQDEKINALRHELFEKNREQIYLISRKARQSHAQNAEVSRSLDLIREKLERNADYLRPKARIEEELKYFKSRLEEFLVITKIINTLKPQRDEIIKLEEDYIKISSESPGPQFSCWSNMGKKIRQRKEYIDEQYSDVTNMLLTFFSFKGSNRIFYADHIGPYYVDEFNHQIYIFDYGLGIYHLNCEGEFVDVHEDRKYYFDENGRYIIENGEKIYQCAPCTSKYKLKDDNNLLQKITQDCGHSELNNLKCRMRIQDITNVEILPTTDIVDIKNTLSAEVVKYLWDNFGHILPVVLHDLGISEPKNPIHRLGHKLLKYHYDQSTKQLHEKIANAQAYRSAIHSERKFKAEKAAKDWKTKQLKRRKPEDLDNAQELAMYDAHIAQQKYINSLNYYNDPC